MALKPDISDLLWMATGAALLAVVILVVLHFQENQNPVQQLAFKAQRVELVDRMKMDLASASEAEKSAVLAITDSDSQKFAEQARSATADVERERGELGELLAAGGAANERELLAQFAKSFGEFRKVDDELLALAVKNTNIKAYGLAFGPAAAALKEMDSALARLVTDDVKVLRVADNARLSAWRLMALIPPHIAEESDPKMDEIESQMAAEDKTVRQSFDVLAALPLFSGNPDLKIAATSYARFSETKTKILKLSRENTNVRSLSISLNQKRNIMSSCQTTLAELKQAIDAEPIAGANYGTVKPR